MTLPPSSSRRGILFLLTAMLVFSLLNAVIKGEATRYPPLQMVFFRCVFAAIPAGVFLILKKGWTAPSWGVWKIYGLRAGIIAVGFTLLFTGIAELPLSDSMALYFSSTFFLAILSYPILKEKVSFLQWIAVSIGIVGIIMIAKPSGNTIQWGTFFVIMGACLEASHNLLGRLISSAQNGYMLTFIGSLLPAFLLLIPLPYVWVTPDFKGWVALIILGLGGGIGQLCVTFAYVYAPAGILAPMVYSAMVWSVLLDIAIYQNWPSLSLLGGCGIIIASGLVILVSEARKERE